MPFRLLWLGAMVLFYLVSPSSILKCIIYSKNAFYCSSSFFADFSKLVIYSMLIGLASSAGAMKNVTLLVRSAVR